jgi:hypothetical protein
MKYGNVYKKKDNITEEENIESEPIKTITKNNSQDKQNIQKDNMQNDGNNLDIANKNNSETIIGDGTFESLIQTFTGQTPEETRKYAKNSQKSTDKKASQEEKSANSIQNVNEIDNTLQNLTTNDQNTVNT